MEEKSNQNLFSDSNFNNEHEISEYEYLLKKRKNIQDTINKLENNFVYK